MREIKFRAWHNPSKSMLSPDGSFIEFDGSVWFNCGDYHDELTEQRDLILMQFTGLTDKHGKDVYEGDIVDICDGIDTKAVVAWNAECASFACDYIGDDSWSEHLFGCELGEVIGNLYENPELLEAN